ncbi:MAG: hypothetical protein KQI62_16665, partial [Deltaproteobacteria bacterium]|nr:hypothetical protein [Deltaproteobacteria bacterium]
KVGGINVLGRNTQGVKLIGLEPSERLVALARLAEADDNGDNGDNGDKVQAPAEAAPPSGEDDA